MVRVAVALIFYTIVSIEGHTGELRVFSFSDKSKPYTVKTEWDMSTRIAVSSHCLLNRENSCLALKKLSEASLKKAQLKRKESSANPGTLICEDLGGRVIIGRDSNGDENSFCKFKDQSLIDCGSLTWYGRNK
jgi:putative hemolysin